MLKTTLLKTKFVLYVFSILYRAEARDEIQALKTIQTQTIEEMRTET